MKMEKRCSDCEMDSVCDNDNNTYTGQSGSSDMSGASSGHSCEHRTSSQCPARGWARLVNCRSAGVCRVCTTFTVIVSLLVANLLQHPVSATGSSSYDETDRWYSQREGDMVKLLGKFGYIKDASQEMGPSGLTSREAYVKAVKTYQRWGNIPETGIVDSRTMQLMRKPRCGNKDIVPEGGGPTMIRRRRKRYVTAPSKWEKHDLTYRILNTTPDLSKATVHRAIRDAFNVWSKVCPLTFTQVLNREADILIQFAENYHQDGYPFDGKGSVLAHAFFPGDDRGGDTHFDDAETWTFNSTEGVDLFMVAAHEFGHALGLAHSSNTEALMYPWYQGYTDGFTLPYDDVQGIQSLYGSKTGGPIPTSRPHTPDVTSRPDYSPQPRPPKNNPEISPCTDPIDALTVIRTEIFVFIGPMFWRLSSNGIRGEPTEISKFWYGLPEGGVDAVYERSDGKIVFFKGDRFWVFSSNYLVTNFPKEGRRITELGIDKDVEKIDAVFVWNYNKRTYLITGDMYWKLNEKDDYIEYDYPRDMSIWWGVKVPVHSAFQHFNGKNYFFKDNNFWEFYDNKMKTRKKKGTPVSKLLGCKDGQLWKDGAAFKMFDNDKDEDSENTEVSYKNNFKDDASAAPVVQCAVTNVLVFITMFHWLH